MKLTGLSVALAALAVQVSASPIRVYVFSGTEVTPADTPEHGAVSYMRWGLPAADAAQPAPPIMRPIDGMKDFDPHGDGVVRVVNSNGFQHHVPHAESMAAPARKHRCGGGLRMKAIAASNWLREKVGLPPIASPHRHGHHGHGMDRQPKLLHGETMVPPLSHAPEQVEGEGTAIPDGAPRHHRLHHVHGQWHWRPSTFAGRLQKALMTLGPWEGRVVAFVIGCGIGSLLRMFYVLFVLTCRSFASRRDEEAEVDVLFAEVEETSPPEYFDEKIAPVDEVSA
ncbi:hypothetical protein M0805_000515 [Coniferiporia weirii]|nr:hypothetical protein M0805_000515 [Coniferiporia weirii]